MATLSQADVEAIVDALVDAILKWSPLHPQTPPKTTQTPAQTVFGSRLIIDDCLPADKPGLSVEIDKCHPAGDVDDCPPAGDVLTSVDAFGQHACASIDAKDVFVDDYDPAEDAGDVHTSVDAIVDNYHPTGDVFIPVNAFCQHADAPIDPPSVEIGRSCLVQQASSSQASHGAFSLSLQA